MPNLVQIEPIALLPTQAGCAIFLGNGRKVIVIYIDPAVGMAINVHLSNQKTPRPLTHDIFFQSLTAFGAKVQRIIIIRVQDEIFYARIILEAQNEIMQRKIVELDARPSDSIALALRAEAPMFMLQELWDTLPDVSETLRKMQENAQNNDD